ncbi:hypothetical protein PF005_g11212 [Phytophthora fragariae]|uniref:Pectate lyase n=2 Tax=Phytophthora TaxID=4783 RepID=A0A6A3KLR3_9STRA|nr:hypothetical protein PF003_g10863 [Phytophthora fragariae]KAE9038417.1 hypothetical protein PR002_g6038 [Phytophthora rubi]KAE8937671.1 hypothetical protein PF009_g12435 [Phytophthora fragariae]KAE9006338.1 hypothetical protein PF011_g11624 [Phytophthora fragariae]KAE9112560.1 hypothetical protein PF007_g11055 [Phytophthora fragariae]
MTTTFKLFVGLSLIAGSLLVYDKTWAGPYKVMNSNHQHALVVDIRGENSCAKRL